MNVIGRPRRLPAAFLGTALLVTVVVGSGIAAAQLSPEDVGRAVAGELDCHRRNVDRGQQPRPVQRPERL